MKPDWQQVILDDGILREPDQNRLVLWLPEKQEDQYRYWQRISSVPGEEAVAGDGLCWMPATLIRTRHKAAGMFGRLFGRLQKSPNEQTWVLPNGQSTEQMGERQSDLLLVWPDAAADVHWRTFIEQRWTEREIRRLGPRLFLVAGVEGPEPTLAAEGKPAEEAEKRLAATRRGTHPAAVALALTDRAMIAIHDGEAERAGGLLEEALAIARQLGDRALETDILGNLSVALLHLGKCSRALELAEQQLQSARAAGNRYEERIALANLGLVHATRREHQRAIAAYQQSLTLARTIGDKKNEAKLLWSLAIQHAELGQREVAVARGEECLTLYRKSGHPDAETMADYLHKYRLGEDLKTPPQPQYAGATVVASGTVQSSAAQATTGPGLLRMALSAAKAMAKYVGSGCKKVPEVVRQKRIKTCSTCEHHTGMRCKVCGCFTAAKTWLPYESCPLGKW